jgi:hypothetical protein
MEVCKMKAKTIKKAMAAALACSLIAGTGVASMSASAKIGDRAAAIIASISAKKSEFKTWLTETIKANFDGEKAKELAAMVTDKVLEMIPEETKEKFEETVQRLIDEQFPKELVKQLVSEFADTAYRVAQAATDVFMKGLENAYAFAERAYMSIPEETRAKIETTITETCAKIKTSLEEINAFVDAVKERAAKYTFYDTYATLDEGEFTFKIYFTLNDGLVVSAFIYNGEDTTAIVPATADGFVVTTVGLNMKELTLKTVCLPETIDELDARDFAGVFTVENIEVSEDNPFFTSVDGVVYNKEGDTLVVVPPARTSFTIPETVTTLGRFCFSYSQVESIDIPETVTTICEEAFCCTPAMEEVTIPESISTIEPGTFAACSSLKKIVVPSTVTKIADDAFDIIAEDAVFYCTSATDYAACYAEKHGFAVNAPLYATFDAPAYVLYGGNATFTVNAKCGAGDYTYTFCVRPAGTEKWNKVYVGADNTFTFSPAYVTDYEVCLKVKDADGTVLKSYSTMKVGQVLNNLSKISADTVEAGSAVTVKCKAVDPKSKFAVYYKEASAETWTMVQNYNANKIVDITFEDAGSYQICVKAKSSLDFISKKYFDVTVE